eukprot:TRINITY_DN5120_c0_g1_i1.p1 TRINITY_DN5120_c0_g1~~TRINITY_DN5120_c0_g1_i1.p1  ORF type:complete len:514 (-),score=87.22 TRINITY_DN5120_c0_g1_i1:440-1981(-)
MSLSADAAAGRNTSAGRGPIAAGRSSIFGRWSIAAGRNSMGRGSVLGRARASMAMALSASDFARKIRSKTVLMQEAIASGSSAGRLFKLAQLLLLIAVPWARGLKTLAYKWADANSSCGAPPALMNFLAGALTTMVLAGIILWNKGQSCFMKLCWKKRNLIYAIPGLCQCLADYFITVSLSLLDVSLFMVICQVEIVFALIFDVIVRRSCPDMILTLGAVMVCILASAFSLIRSCESEGANPVDMSGVLFLNIALFCYALSSVMLEWLAKQKPKHTEENAGLGNHEDEELSDEDESDTGLVAKLLSMLMLQVFCVPCSLVIFACFEAGLLVQHGIDACITTSFVFSAVLPLAANTSIYTASVMVCGNLPVQLAAAVTSLITFAGNALVFGGSMEAVPLLILVGLMLSNILAAVSLAKVAEFGKEAKLAAIAEIQQEIQNIQTQAASSKAASSRTLGKQSAWADDAGVPSLLLSSSSHSPCDHGGWSRIADDATKKTASSQPQHTHVLSNVLPV